MNASEISNLVLTIVLGFVSIGLGIFAVWLSVRFNEQSSAALNAIKDLASEIRTLSQVNISQQTDFSSKMLDTILSQSRFGEDEATNEFKESSALEDVVKRQLEETEQRITTSLEEKVRAIITSKNDPNIIQHAIDSIRSDIRMLTDKASSISSNVEIPTNLREQLIEWKSYPAMFVLLAAIVKENAKSVADMAIYKDKYNLPVGWQGGVGTIIRKGLLTGSTERFEIVPEYQTPIAALIDKNWPIIQKLIEYYGSIESEKGVTTDERLLGQNIDI